MKRFIYKTILYAAPILLFLLGLDIFISHRLKQNEMLAYGEISTWNDIYTNNVNSDILIYGSSRAAEHYNPEIITKELNHSTYNFGMEGCDMLGEYFRHLEFLRNNTKLPKLIIFNLDTNIHTTNKKETKEDISKIYREDQLLPYMFFNPKMYLNIKESHIDGFNWASIYFPMYRYTGRKGILFDILEKTEGRDRGFNPNNEVYDPNKKKHDINDVSGYNHFYLSKIRLSLLEKIIYFCKANNIEIVFVNSPSFYTYKNYINYKEIIENNKKIANKHNIKYLDFSDFPLNKDPKYFRNIMHLNEKGANVFSKMLCDSITTNHIKLD